MKLLLFMMLLAQAHADCAAKTKSTNECCGDENKQCDWIDHCTKNEDGDSVCRFDGQWIGWAILIVVVAIILWCIGDCLWQGYNESKNAAASVSNNKEEEYQLVAQTVSNDGLKL